MEEEITLTINAEELYRELAEIEAKAQEIRELIGQVEKESQVSFSQIMGAVHAGWLATQGMVRAAGGSIATVFRTVIGTVLGTISVLAPLFTAMEVTPGMQIQATIGMISLITSFAALEMAKRDEMEFSDQLRGANMALHGIQSLIGSFNF